MAKRKKPAYVKAALKRARKRLKAKRLYKRLKAAREEEVLPVRVKRVYKKRKQAMLAEPGAYDVSSARVAVAAEGDRIPDNGGYERGYDRGLNEPSPYGIDDARRSHELAVLRLTSLERDSYNLRIALAEAVADVQKTKLVLEARTAGISDITAG